ncbi:LytR/AlgR family response regulator transcription factor [Anaerocolumna xylanovorans]|uniref:Stage 0 sporulation protein A homolog n=1 Tax=Anaerocolumna xylanovorans DSM 12503 TaxID=1121345 RepID=A0A1M7YK77_9FIRM|nr:LytTR family DNA-binding domain-containing protein [Anaerocolumna xylanovorans]SHO53002.1 two component transcriptional regulator, LytTR family [Anaerocolumna xylanovorans DSM 12503]
MLNHYRIATCDDEIYYQDELCNLLKTYENESGNKLDICRFSSGEKLLEQYEEAIFHILILDIEMGGLSGMETAKEIRKIDEDVIIIFATSFDNYALGAFEVNALNYLVKPVDYVKLKKVMSIATAAVDFKRDQISARKRYLEVRVKNTDVHVEIAKIKYIEKKRNASVIHTSDNEYACYEPLAQLHDRLDVNKFCYVHQGYIVNLDMIQEVGKTMIVLADYIEVPISRKYYKSIKERFMNRIYVKLQQQTS